MVITIVSVPKATAQIPLLPYLPNPSSVNNTSENTIVSEWVYLDGRPLFQIAASKTDVSERLQNIQLNLQEISQDYFYSSTQKLNVQVRKLRDLPVIYVNEKYLMTVNSDDAKLRQVDSLTLTNQIAEDLQKELELAKKERQTSSLIGQGKIAGSLALAMLLTSLLIYRYQRRFKKDDVEAVSPTNEIEQPITTQLNQQQHQHLAEVQKRLFQLTQTGIWGGGSFIVLGLFPYTRALQLGILAAAQIPLKVGIVVLGTYVAIRFSYALIDKFTTTLISGGVLLNSETSERMQLRVSTFSGVTKSITTLIWMGVGILLTLIALGIDIVPLLAGAGLIGVAVSLASQNLIKDAINGFLIILEDQYALGDVINVGDVGGLVENLNLRMTQVRDAEGRLITIPNSEVKIVANLSSRWSRADLTIPVSYQANIDEALQLIEDVAVKMNQEPFWKRQIIEKPSILGIDNFSDRGMMIRVWIKTQPLKQWDVAREYRRRLKIALDQADISIPIPQQAIWINDSHLLNYEGNSASSPEVGRHL
ncbi:mechanosensitive ion channel family protein [Anabaena cylindrica FACHB-243]|nr:MULTISPECIES: mechanosensitive ion channel family protein [Anabaena]MBD2416418.1 mechanosensitive ion channel family protein [Anabaena cylindrica FACHB-243]MBY5280560.1 mechanosensitive ion channel family protein [Anabaena sp. CCAP 1446/1C]MBY5309045.1 mechanosensitive ion channel family protein [Anabaena sp. CCAP 1446/1C]MCM2408471.1 mechanosensitive ion channel family protein [Anabaena sp. CCAP 1446/1C]